MTDQHIHIVEYDHNWPNLFEVEKKALTALLSPWIKGSIEHVGSTAIPYLCAKPIIDIMVGVHSLADSQLAIEVLEEYGYSFYPYKKDVMHWFCKPSPEHRTHHVHLIPFESNLWFERINFRDRLQKDKKLALEYGKLKQQLAKTHSNDREGYTINKWPFIEKVLSFND